MKNPRSQVCTELSLVLGLQMTMPFLVTIIAGTISTGLLILLVHKVTVMISKEPSDSLGCTTQRAINTIHSRQALG